jgi:hypothetical protein
MSFGARTRSQPVCISWSELNGCAALGLIGRSHEAGQPMSAVLGIAIQSVKNQCTTTGMEKSPAPTGVDSDVIGTARR